MKLLAALLAFCRDYFFAVLIAAGCACGWLALNALEAMLR